MKIKKNKGTDNCTPQLRFPEFKEEWRNEKLGKHIRKTDKKNKENLNLPVYSINNKDGFLPQSEQFDGVNSSERGFDISIYKIIQPNTFAYNPARINVGSIGYSHNLENILISSLYVCFQTDNEVDDSFLLAFLNTNHFNISILRFQEGGVRQYLFFDNLSKIKLPFPTLAEQKKIAHFFSVIDKKLSLLAEKKTALEQYKKGMMQGLFYPYHDLNDYPDDHDLKNRNNKTQENQNNQAKSRCRLRFKDDNGQDYPEWEVKKLGEVCAFSKGKGISKKDIVENGETKCIRYGELYTHYNEIITAVISKTNVNSKNLVFSKENDVIIPASGEDRIDIATASCITNSGIAIGGDINIIRSNNNGIFLSYYLNSIKKKEIANLAQGASVVHLYSSQLSLLSINIPTLAEQEKIAHFLSKIDDKIHTVSEQIAQTKEYKKGLLQKMFCN